MKLEFCENAVLFADKIALAEKACFSEPWSEKAVCDFLGYDYNGAVVCTADGEFAGYVTYTAICGELQICNVATLEKFRRCGVGTALMQEIKRRAERLSCEVVTLEVRSQNTPARSLYEKCGFENVGVRKGFYKKPDDDAVLMNLNLC